MYKQTSLDIFDDIEEKKLKTVYTKKIDVPLYVPKYEKPNIQELYDHYKFLNLVKEIKESNVTEDEKKFLIFAAHRHIIINFSKVADYYAHATQEMQELMEKSALVIIDFDKAIEYGYAILNENLSHQFLEDQNG